MNANAPWRWVALGPDRFELIATRPLVSADPGEPILSVRGRNGVFMIIGSGIRETVRLGGPCPVRMHRNPNRPHSPREPITISSTRRVLETAAALARRAGLHEPPGASVAQT